jgi:hypothetical protein
LTSPAYYLILPKFQSGKIRGLHRDATQFIHLLQVGVSDGGNVIEIKAETEFGTESMLDTPDDLDFRGTFDKTAAVLAISGIVHNLPPYLNSTS